MGVAEVIDSVVKLGFPAAIAVYLIWFFTTKISAVLDTLVKSVQAMSENMADMAREMAHISAIVGVSRDNSPTRRRTAGADKG